MDTIFCPPYDAFMEFDYMDELLSGGFWLDGSEFSHYNASTPSGPFDPSLVWPNLEERQRSTFHDNLSISESQGPKNTAKSHSNVWNATNDGVSLGQSDRYLDERLEPKKIGQMASISIVDRLVWALGYIKDYSRDKDVLIQVWVPVNKGGRRVLTTNDQPFSLDLNCPRLVHYREISVNYHFPVEEASKGAVGLPGRVFLGKVPEWSPDVRFFTRDEYPRVGHAKQYDVRGTFAVPVLEQGSSNCLGVIEVILTKEKMKYSAELESVCKALEAVDLRSSEVSSLRNVKTCDLSYQAALPEILEVFRSACETHRVPLAQTWVPCVLQGKGGSRHSDENLLHCVSTVDSACYIADPSTHDFHEACSEHHLLKNQGTVGRAFMTNQPCFSSDVTAYSKNEYPLSHHAKMFGLCAAVAIRLRSICTGPADFVLEFFLPKDCRDPQGQKEILCLLSNVIQKVCRTLRVVTDEELQGESVSPVCEVANPTVTRSGEEIPKVDKKDSLRPSPDIMSWNGKPREILVERSSRDQPDSNSRAGFAFDGIPSTSTDDSSHSTSKTVKRRRKKAEKTVTLQVLQQYFAGSLKDAAMSIGVCPTTLKRICRRHGIMRWPSRKIKKVGHSLEKIQRVIDSVPGASALQIESFYSNFPELASPNVSRNITQFANSNPSDCPNPLGRQPENDVFSSMAGASKSPTTSCSQNSSSTQSYSSERQQNPYTFNVSGSVVWEESVNGLLKRSRSDGNLHLSSDVKTFGEPSKQESFLAAWTDNGTQSRDGDAQRVKVTYGEEKIRFRMKNKPGYENLLHEIATRFNIDDASGFHLKYLDDDLEWVLLTCDADLVECIDVYRSSQSRTIKLSLHCDSQPHVGSSYDSSSFL